MKNPRIFFLLLSAALAAPGRPPCHAAATDSLSLAGEAAALASAIKPIAGEPGFFPIVTQFSPVPDGNGWKGGNDPLGADELRDTIENILAHGFTGIESNVNRPEREKAFILNYAQSRGMVITHHAGALEGFGRTKPPAPSVFSPDYEKAVFGRAVKALAAVRDIPRLYNVFPYQDEPFHWGPGSFGYGADEKKAFRDRYGYDLPPDIDSVRNDPKKWLDVLNFRSDEYPDGWRKTYRIVKDLDPRFIVTMTHDSHNTFGAGYGSHAGVAVDDVYHWGGDFADMFVFDIYPYMMLDFRFGEPSKYPLPRISQAHYAFAQMRNLAVSYGKKLGFWVGTYNPRWFKNFMGEEIRSKYWSEHEMTMTAVAQGSDYILTGYHIPVDSLHWETFGRGNRLIQKTGGDLLKTRKTRAKACMLFPRTHYLQMQEEYFNVGLSYELFLRAFGELDILHEEQVVDDRLAGYTVLVLFDVRLLPEKTARLIASFVQSGGTVIADCVPSLDEYKKPMTVMDDLFGVTGAATGRIVRTGHWVNTRTEPGRWDFRGVDAPDESVYETDRLKGSVYGVRLDFTIVSPRPCTVKSGKVPARTTKGVPAVVRRDTGKGHAFLLGFCLQDTYFRTWKEADVEARGQLYDFLHALTVQAGVRPRIWSSNPDIEASARTGPEGGFLFVINHEAEKTETLVRLADLGFTVGGVVDMETGGDVTFTVKKGIVEIPTAASKDRARLFRLVKR